MPTGKKLMGNTIAREQWLLRECRIVAAMRLSGMSDVEAAAAVKRENLFQYPTERTLTRISKACNKRIDAVRSREIVEIVAEGLPDAAAQANLYMMMCTYPLVRHFMLDEIARRFAELDDSFSATDMNAYFVRLEEEFDNFATSSETTIAKLKQVLKKCLVEVGMLESVRSERLVPIYIDSEVRAAIEAKGDYAALPAFNCREAC